MMNENRGTPPIRAASFAVRNAPLIFLGLLLLIFGLFPSLAFAEQLRVNAELTRITIQCGKHTVVIKCGKTVDPDYPEDERRCNNNTLGFLDSDGKEFIPPIPKNFDESKTPVSMSCKKSRINGKYFVLVELSNGPSGCLPCMTYHLFSESGDRLIAERTDAMRDLARHSKELELYEIVKRAQIEPDPSLKNINKGEQ